LRLVVESAMIVTRAGNVTDFAGQTMIRFDERACPGLDPAS